MGKLKTFWPEIVFFLITLMVGLWSHWGKGSIGQWGINSTYINSFGDQLIPRKFQDNASLLFLFFWTATIFVYLSAFEIFRNRKWSFITVLMFYCTPVLPGIAFWDPVNSPLLAYLMISIYLLIKFVHHPGYLFAFLLAVFHFLAIFSHPLSVAIPGITICFFLLNFFTRNLTKKDILKIVLYLFVLCLLLIILKYGLHYSITNVHRDFLPTSWKTPWTRKFEWIFITLPPLWILYFIFSVVALNVVYFSNYSVFLKTKWIYSYLFILLLGFAIVPRFLPPHILLFQERYISFLPSIIFIGVAGCYEFAVWVRKRWGEKVYFVFKALFLPVFLLQCLWSVVAIVWLHPEYHLYTNWPLFFMR